MLTRIHVHAFCDSRCPNNSLARLLCTSSPIPLHALARPSLHIPIQFKWHFKRNHLPYCESESSDIFPNKFRQQNHWGTSMACEDYGALVAKTTPKRVRIGNPLRYGPMMGNVNEGKGLFATR
ncbi:hypothetical protein LXL04_001584 [Taraxacum kok-saghyz]